MMMVNSYNGVTAGDDLPCLSTFCNGPHYFQRSHCSLSYSLGQNSQAVQQ